MKLYRREEQARLDRFPGVPRYSLIDSSLGSARLHVGDLTYEPGSAVPHHSHPDAEETQIMLTGELECWLDGHRFLVRAGDCVVAKRGVRHAFFNRSNSPARMVTLFAVSPPITELTPDPELEDRPPSSGVEFAMWPVGELSVDKVKRYAVNAPVGASETEAKLFALPVGGSTIIAARHGQEIGGFCLDGLLSVSSGKGTPQTVRPGDFVFADSNELAIRNSGESAATLLAVYSLID